MRITKTTTVLAAAAGLAALPAPALAEERTCRGTIGASTVDNLAVPDGATCKLKGTKVKGTIKVGTGATLSASKVRVVGNVQGEGARKVSVKSSRVGGSIQLVQGGSASLRSNRVKADVQLFENSGVLVVSRNTIDGNLQCKENGRAPSGGGNVVQGNKEDQCARL